MNFELTGVIIEILPEVQVNDRFKKQEFVIEKKDANGNFNFTDFIKFQLTQDKTSLIKSFKTGEEVKVSFNIRGNKWVNNGQVNYFTNLDAWRIEKASGSSANGGEIPAPQIPNDPETEIPGGFDDLPF